MSTTTKGQRQAQFGKWCGSIAVVLLFVVFVASFFQERIRKRFRKKISSKRKDLCASDESTTVRISDMSPDEVQESIRQSLIVKKYLIVDDENIAATLSTFPCEGISVPMDIEANDAKDDSSVTESNTEGSGTENNESSSKNNNDNNMAKENKVDPTMDPTPPRKLPRFFSGFAGGSSSKSTRINSDHENFNKTQQVVCEMCDKAFEHGDDVCDSCSPRCAHVFHHQCITPWLSIQNSCPCCSEPFVLLKHVQLECAEEQRVRLECLEESLEEEHVHQDYMEDVQVECVDGKMSASV